MTYCNIAIQLRQKSCFDKHNYDPHIGPIVKIFGKKIPQFIDLYASI